MKTRRCKNPRCREVLSVENAYQAAKTEKNRPTTRAHFATLTPAKAKAEGRKLPLRKDWPKVKFGIMSQLLVSKFTDNPELAEALAETRGRMLIELNHWHDETWGVDVRSDTGFNLLGLALTNVRAFLFNTEVGSHVVEPMQMDAFK